MKKLSKWRLFLCLIGRHEWHYDQLVAAYGAFHRECIWCGFSQSESNR